MEVYRKVRYGEQHLCTVTSLYSTPRAVLIELLNDSNPRSPVKWIERGTLFEILDNVELGRIWAERALKKPFEIEPYALFEDGISGSVEQDEEASVSGKSVYKITSKSTDRRKYVDDLNKGELSEWMVKFLLEQSRVDWIQWTDKDKLEFSILNIQEFANTFLKFSGTNRSMQTVLAEYCQDGTLIEMERGIYRYQFNDCWYNLEVNRKRKKETVQWTRVFTRVQYSRHYFPSLTHPYL